MKKLSNPINSGRLRTFTNLSPQLSKSTRWSSTYQMLSRFLAMKECLPKLGVREINQLIPSLSSVRKIEQVCSLLQELDVVTKELQRENLDLADVRILFDNVIEEYSESAHYLSSNASIVHTPDFETGLVKLLDSQESLLTDNESHAVRDFQVKTTSSDVANE